LSVETFTIRAYNPFPSIIGTYTMRKITMLFTLFLVVCWNGTLEAQQQERYIFDQNTHKWLPAEQIEKPYECMLGQAQELISQQKYRKAERILKKFLKQQLDDKDRRAAMLLYADCAFLRGKYSKAHKRYHQIINMYPNTREFAIALRRELDIARAWLAGKKRRVLGIFWMGAEDEALDILSMIEQNGAGHRIAEVALREKADYFFRTGQFELAELAFRRLAKEYRSKRYRQYAMYRSAASALASFPGVAFDDTPLIEAAELYKEYLENFPSDSKKPEIKTILEQIRDRRAHKDFEIGKFYEKIRRAEAAAYYFRVVIRNWPDTLWAQRARVELERLGFDVDDDNNS